MLPSRVVNRVGAGDFKSDGSVKLSADLTFAAGLAHAISIADEAIVNNDGKNLTVVGGAAEATGTGHGGDLILRGGLRPLTGVSGYGGNVYVDGANGISGKGAVVIGTTAYTDFITIGNGTNGFSVDAASIQLSVGGTTKFTVSSSELIAGGIKLSGLHGLEFSNLFGSHSVIPTLASAVGGSGPDLIVSSAAGTAGSAGVPGGSGGVFNAKSGSGGAGSGAQIAGVGGFLGIYAGDGGKDNGGGGANGGAIQIMTGGGTGTHASGALSIDVGAVGAGTPGVITLGDTNALQVVLGRSGSNVKIAAGSLLSTTTTGNINLPNNGSARFNIEGSAVSANVTAANLTALTGGGSTALHTHAGSASGPSGVDSMIDVAAWTSGTYANIIATGAVDLSVTIVAPGAGFFIASWDANYMRHNGAGGIMDVFFQFMLDGVAVPGEAGTQLAGFGLKGSLSMTRRFAVTAGSRKVKVQVKVVNNGGPDVRMDTTSSPPANGILTVEFVSS